MFSGILRMPPFPTQCHRHYHISCYRLLPLQITQSPGKQTADQPTDRPNQTSPQNHQSTAHSGQTTRNPNTTAMNPMYSREPSPGPNSNWIHTNTESWANNRWITTGSEDSEDSWTAVDSDNDSWTITETDSEQSRCCGDSENDEDTDSEAPGSPNTSPTSNPSDHHPWAVWQCHNCAHWDCDNARVACGVCGVERAPTSSNTAPADSPYNAPPDSDQRWVVWRCHNCAGWNCDNMRVTCRACGADRR